MNQLPKIDVHGMTSEQAVKTIRINLKEFHERGYPELYTIHGKGQGILRQKIRSLLRQIHYIKGFRAGKLNEGGNGVTVVLF
jgi:DNA mismatch repair protein MutS2